MAGRGPQTFKKRQKEQQRKEKQEEKRARRLERKTNPSGSDIDVSEPEDLSYLDRNMDGDDADLDQPTE